MTKLLYLSTAVTLVSGILVAILALMPWAAQRAMERLLEVTRGGTMHRQSGGRWEEPSRMFFRIAHWFDEHLGWTQSPGLQERLKRAGLNGQIPAEVYRLARVLCPVSFLLLGSLLPSDRFFWMIAFGALAYLVPDLALSYCIHRRSEKLRRSLPELVDLLVICVDAGLGLDQAMLRVAVELSLSHPEANEELLHVYREQRAGKPRMDAWVDMAARVRLQEIDSLVNMLMQTERFGTPISKALSSFAESLRIKRRQSAEEKAAKATIKIIFPLVFLIFPAIFIVLLGPTVLNIIRILH